MKATEIVDEATLQARVAELAGQLDADYRDREPVLLAVLTGAVPFLADLTRGMHPRLDIDFLSLNRFGVDGKVGIAMDSATSIAGRDVLIVEDIVDTGLTLSYLLGLLRTRQPASLATVSLLDKRTRRIVDVPIEYRGFEVGDEFLVGYGLDWHGQFRNVRSLWAVMDLAELQADPDAVAAEVFARGGDRLAP
jgi:hypoxanthine phosphoribosyltransferase